MQATNVPCPHCRNQLLDDGRFAGQVVQCPTCQQQFQMPFQATPVMTNVAAPVQDPFAFSAKPTTSASSYIAPRPKPSILPWVIVVVAFLLLVGGVFAYYMSQLQRTFAAEDKLNEVLFAWMGGKSITDFNKSNPDIILDGNTFGSIANIDFDEGVPWELKRFKDMSESDFLRALRGESHAFQQAAIHYRSLDRSGPSTFSTGRLAMSLLRSGKKLRSICLFLSKRVCVCFFIRSSIAL